MLFSRKKKEAKKAKKAALNIRSRPVLGVPLSESALTNKSHDGIPVPVIVRLCIDYVDEFGLTVEGIYRISSPKTRLDELEKLANEYGVVVFEDPHEAAGLLKRFLRQLPENILTDKLIDKFDKASGAKLKDLLHQLPIQNYFLLAYVFIHCQKIVMMSSENKMNIPALGVLLQQILDAPRNIVRIFLLNASELLNSNGLKANYLFENITLKR
uniref:Rho-GAP domain-containing protein n=1 Tax=Rhabditophanes sp. KR3021 TaxID=114890 RepID=A0AC35TH54_9BILA